MLRVFNPFERDKLIDARLFQRCGVHGQGGEEQKNDTAMSY